MMEDIYQRRYIVAATMRFCVVKKKTIVNVKSFLIKFVSLKSFHDVGPHADGLGMINMNNSLSEYNDDKNAL